MSRAESPLRGRMIFNVGAQRSGTFWLQRIVTSHPAISAVPSETTLFSDGIAPLFERFHHGARSSEQVGALFIEREALLDTTRDLCDLAFAPYLDPEARYLAERTSIHVRHLQLIDDIFPDARFIHIIRDGRDVAQSLTTQAWGPGALGCAAEEWRSCIETARSARLPPDRYCEVRYEALLAEPKEIITGLFDWLSLPTNEEVLSGALSAAGTERNLSRHGPKLGVAAAKWKSTFTREQLAEFERVAGDVRAELGYPAAETDRQSNAVRASLRQTAGGLRTRAKRMARRRFPTVVRSWTDFYNRERLANRALGALLDCRLGEVSDLMASDAVVTVVSSNGTEVASGAAADNLLQRTVVKDRALAGRQLVGDAYPGVPTFGCLLTLAVNGEQPADRAVFLTVDGGRLTELTIYLLPLTTGG